MNLVQQAGCEAIFNELMDRESLDLVAEYHAIEARFLELKLPKAFVTGTMKSLMIARAREKQARHRFAADSALNAVAVLRENFGTIASGLGTQVLVNASNRNYQNSGDGTVADEVNNNSGQVVNQGGSHNRARVDTMNQAVGNIDSQINWSGMSDELSKLKAALDADDSDDPEHILAKGAVTAAEAAAKKQDEGKLVQCLKAAGNGIWKVATTLGLPLLLDYLKDKVGLGQPAAH